MTRFWILRDGRIVGPYAPHELTRDKHFDEDSLVCAEHDVSENTASWVPAGLRAELVGVFAERRRLSRFWVYMEGRVVGPVPARELWALKGFDSQVLVCRDGDKTGAGWNRADHFPELLDLMPRPDAQGAEAALVESGPVGPAPELVSSKDMLRYVETAQKANFLMFRETRRKLGSLERALGELRAELAATADAVELRRTVADVEKAMEELKQTTPVVASAAAKTVTEEAAAAAAADREKAASEIKAAVGAMKDFQKSFEERVAALQSEIDGAMKARQAQQAPVTPATHSPMPADAVGLPPSQPALPDLPVLKQAPVAPAAPSAMPADAAGLPPSQPAPAPAPDASLSSLFGDADGGLGLGAAFGDMGGGLSLGGGLGGDLGGGLGGDLGGGLGGGMSFNAPAPVPPMPQTSAPEPEAPVAAAFEAIEAPVIPNPFSIVEAPVKASEATPQNEPSPGLSSIPPAPLDLPAYLPPPPAPEPAPEPPRPAPARAEERISLLAPAPVDRTARWAALAAVAAFLVAACALLMVARERRRPLPSAALEAPVSVPGEEIALNLVKRAPIDASGTTVEAALARVGAAQGGGGWSSRREADGMIEVSFVADGVDLETGGQLVYVFRVDPAKGSVRGANLPARTILREP